MSTMPALQNGGDRTLSSYQARMVRSVETWGEGGREGEKGEGGTGFVYSCYAYLPLRSSACLCIR